MSVHAILVVSCVYIYVYIAEAVERRHVERERERERERSSLSMERVETHWRKGARILCRDPCRRPTRLHFSIRGYNDRSRLEEKIPSGEPTINQSCFFIQDLRVYS